MLAFTLTAAACAGSRVRPWLVEVGICDDPNVLWAVDARDKGRDPVLVRDRNGTPWSHLLLGCGKKLPAVDGSHLQPVGERVSQLCIEFPSVTEGMETLAATHLYRSGRLIVHLRSKTLRSTLESIPCTAARGMWTRPSGRSGSPRGVVSYERVALLVLNAEMLSKLQTRKLAEVRCSSPSLPWALHPYASVCVPCGRCSMARVCSAPRTCVALDVDGSQWWRRQRHCHIRSWHP
jgi:hypothetical protein